MKSNLKHQIDGFGSEVPEIRLSLSLAESVNGVEVDYSHNPHLLIEIEEFRDVVGLASAVQAGLLVNQDLSCWITNLGQHGSTELYRPGKKTYRKLAHNQVAYLRQGDFLGFYGAFYRIDFKENRLILTPIEAHQPPSKLAS